MSKTPWNKNKSIGQKIKELRERLKLTQKEFCQIEGWMIKVRSSRIKKPDLSEIEQAFNALNFAVAVAEEKRMYNNKLDLEDFEVIAEKAQNFLKKF